MVEEVIMTIVGGLVGYSFNERYNYRQLMPVPALHGGAGDDSGVGGLVGHNSAGTNQSQLCHWPPRRGSWK